MLQTKWSVIKQLMMALQMHLLSTKANTQMQQVNGDLKIGIFALE